MMFREKSLLRLLRVSGIIASMAVSSLSQAVGLGEINVFSAMGQPLIAEIELVAADDGDKTSMQARLASLVEYKQAGLEYPFGMKYNFRIEQRANGESYIRLSSNRPVNDPYVSLLVELPTSEGTLLHTYTFLLDPPKDEGRREPVVLADHFRGVTNMIEITGEQQMILSGAAVEQKFKPTGDIIATRRHIAGHSPKSVHRRKNRSYARLSIGEHEQATSAGSDDDALKLRMDNVLLDKDIVEAKQRLAQLKSEAMALVELIHKYEAAMIEQNGMTSASAVLASGAAVSQVVQAPVINAAKPVVAEKKDKLMIMDGVAPAGLSIGSTALLFFALIMRRKQAVKVENSVESNNVTVLKPQLVGPTFIFPPTENSAPIHPEDGTHWIGEDEVDAIKEANLFLKFGRYKQAKEVLHDALVIEPHNHTVRLKILEIEENFREGQLVRAG